MNEPMNLVVSDTMVTDPKSREKKKNKRNRCQQRNKDSVDDPSRVNAAGKGTSRRNRPMSEKQLSHSLSWALRHAALNIGLTIREDGFVPVKEILDSTHPKLRGATLEKIRTVVEKSDKKRFKLEERPIHKYYPQKEGEKKISNHGIEKYDVGLTETKKILCIRANQGHSITLINPELLLEKLKPSEVRSLPYIVHGTYLKAWESIQKEHVGGLKKMNRTHIHFAVGLPTDDGVISGMRKNCTVYIFLDRLKCAADDRLEFYRSDNGVILTDGIKSNGVLPIEYFSHVTDSSGRILLENREKSDLGC